MSKALVDLSIIQPDEREALVQFREKIPDILAKLNEYKSHDLWLLRWLRARELNIEKSEEMLRKSMEWRANEKIDTISDWKIPQFIEDNFTMKVTGFDKDGCVIAIIPYGHWDVRNAVKTGVQTDFVRYVDLMFEKSNNFAEHRSTKDRMLTQFVLILDFEDFSLKQVTSKETIDCIVEVVRRFEANHPETLKAAWVVNAPKIFELLFALVKPLLSARTMSKVHVHGSNSESWRQKLLENIEPDQLPADFGGSNTSCKDYKVEYGYDVFPTYEALPESKFISKTVDAGGKHVIKFTLKPGNKLSWNFRTTDYDIGFSLLYSSSNEPVDGADSKVLFNSARADSHLHLMKGAHVAEEAGVYSVVFDNSYSRLRPKSLQYYASAR